MGPTPAGPGRSQRIFQRLMDTTLAGLLWLSVVVYLDDCVWWDTDFASSLARGDAVFSRFDDRNIRLQASKCHWFFRELRLLGHIANGENVVIAKHLMEFVYPDPASSQ